MSETLLKIMREVESLSLEHGRGMIHPDEIIETRRASCFGVLAFVGSQLIAEGVPETDLGWLISLNHGLRLGQENPDGTEKHYLGHAMLTCLANTQTPRTTGKRQIITAPLLVDSMGHGAFTRRLQSMTWASAREQRLPIIDHVVLSEIERDAYAEAESTQLPKTAETARVYALRAFFAHYGFEEGMAYYQREHPLLAQSTPVTPADYAAAFATIRYPEHVPGADVGDTEPATSRGWKFWLPLPLPNFSFLR